MSLLSTKNKFIVEKLQVDTDFIQWREHFEAIYASDDKITAILECPLKEQSTVQAPIQQGIFITIKQLEEYTKDPKAIKARYLVEKKALAQDNTDVLVFNSDFIKSYTRTEVIKLITTDKEWFVANRTLYSQLYTSCTPKALALITKSPKFDGFSLWQKLRTHFENPSLKNTFREISNFFSNRQGMTQSMEAWLTQVDKQHTGLQQKGVPVPQLFLQAAILGGLREEFNTIRTVVENINNITYEEMSKKLKAHVHTVDEEEKVQVFTSNKMPYCKSCKRWHDKNGRVRQDSHTAKHV